MADNEDLRATTDRVEELAVPRASAGLVVTVVLAAEAVAASVAFGVRATDHASTDPLLATGAVVLAAVTALSLMARSGRLAEAGNTWLAAAWTTIAVMAGPVVASLPTQVTNNPAGPGTDRALLTVLTWTIVLAIAVAGADRLPRARLLPWALMAALGTAATLGGEAIVEGALLAPDGPTFGYGLLGGAALALAIASVAWWLHRWTDRGGWALTWSGVGLVLMTLATILELTAIHGSDRAWAAASALVLSALVVPGVGAGAAGLALAGARRLARRRLARDLVGVDDDPLASLPMFSSLEVHVDTVVNLATGEPTGAIASAHLPGTGLDLNWWRAQAASMGLAERFEVVLASRALEVARRDRADAWLIMPIGATGVSPDLMDLLSGPSAGHLVAVLDGGGRHAARVLEELRERGVNTGMRVTRVDTRLVAAVRSAQPSLLLLDGPQVADVATDVNVHAAVADVMAFAEANSLAVMAAGVDDAMSLAVLRELGVRYASGDAVVARVHPVPPSADGEAKRAAMSLIEAAGLRQRQE